MVTTQGPDRYCEEDSPASAVEIIKVMRKLGWKPEIDRQEVIYLMPEPEATGRRYRHYTFKTDAWKPQHASIICSVVVAEDIAFRPVT